jgi:hypothetical protein
LSYRYNSLTPLENRQVLGPFFVPCSLDPVNPEGQDLASLLAAAYKAMNIRNDS